MSLRAAFTAAAAMWIVVVALVSLTLVTTTRSLDHAIVRLNRAEAAVDAANQVGIDLLAYNRAANLAVVGGEAAGGEREAAEARLLASFGNARGLANSGRDQRLVHALEAWRSGRLSRLRACV